MPVRGFAGPPGAGSPGLPCFCARASSRIRVRRALVTIYESLDILILETERVARSVNAEMIPTPDHRLQSKLAYVGWQVNQFRRTLPAKSETERLKHIAKLVDELANLCDRFRPPSVRTKPIDVCHAHVRAELETGIDSKYRRWHLCRWCGDFRMTHGVNPPAKLVRLHDRGVQMTTSLLRSAGIVRKPTAS